VSGEWTGTMCSPSRRPARTSPKCAPRRRPDGDGYRIRGQKIFITFGEHDMAPNIIHLVLARLPGAPEGTKGISMFIVPKVLVNSDGSLGARNDVVCAGIEHKLGINANPTCTLVYGDGGQGALGYLVGEANRGLEYMFVMMNAARFSVGVQGLAIADRAYQHAVEYAKERIQFRDAASRDPKPVAIIKHPDVRRMLLWCKANIEAMRALAYVTAASLDYAHKSEDEAVRKEHKAFVELMIPIVKGWLTERGIDIARPRCRSSAGWATSRRPGSRSSTATCASRRSTRAPPGSRRSTWSAASSSATWAPARPRSSSRSASSQKSWKRRTTPR